MKIYRKKKGKKKESWRGCNLSVTIRIPYNSDISRVWINGETYNRFGDKVLVTIRISYNSGISRVWVNEETHDRYGDTITPKFKKRLNKWQSVKQKIKKKERK